MNLQTDPQVPRSAVSRASHQHESSPGGAAAATGGGPPDRATFDGALRGLSGCGPSGGVPSGASLQRQIWFQEHFRVIPVPGVSRYPLIHSGSYPRALLLMLPNDHPPPKTRRMNT